MNGMLGSVLSDILVSTLDQAPVVLGPVRFEGHEVPSRIGVGGAHAVTIHKLPGGGRVIDAMGVDDGAISWSGFFTGPYAASRARLVDTMRQSGELVGLSFSDYAFNVVVVHFEYDLQDRGAFINYRIRTEVVPESWVQVDDTSAGLTRNLLADLGYAASAMSSFGIAAAQTAIAAVQTSISGFGDPTSAIKLAAVGAGLHGAASVIQSVVLSSGAMLASSRLTSGSSVNNAADLTGLTSSAGALAGAVQAAGYVNRSNLWLGELSGQPQSGPLISG